MYRVAVPVLQRDNRGIEREISNIDKQYTVAITSTIWSVKSWLHRSTRRNPPYYRNGNLRKSDTRSDHCNCAVPGGDAGFFSPSEDLGVHAV